MVAVMTNLRSTAGLILGVLALLAGCSSTSTLPGASGTGTSTVAPSNTSASTDAASTGEASTGVVPTGATTASASGMHRMDAFTVDGTVIDFAVVEPDGFKAGDVHPVLLAMPPGGQDRQTTEDVVDRRWAAEARRLGWVVISPVAPASGLYYEAASARLIPGLLDALAARYPAEGGKPHLAGISNGGLSAFRIALDRPDRFLSLSTLPGYPPEPADAGHLDVLKAMPVALYVGGDDSGWREESEKTSAALKGLGATVTLDVVAGDDHFLRDLTNEQVFAALESFRHRA